MRTPQRHLNMAVELCKAISRARDAARSETNLVVGHWLDPEYLSSDARDSDLAERRIFEGKTEFGKTKSEDVDMMQDTVILFSRRFLEKGREGNLLDQ